MSDKIERKYTAEQWNTAVNGKPVIGRIKQHKIVNVKFTVKTHNQFKSLCASRGLTMQEFIVAMVEGQLS